MSTPRVSAGRTGIFAIGERPTGNKDPFGLRRGALGIQRILIEKGLELDPDATFGPAQPITMTKGDVLALVTDGFMMEFLQSHTNVVFKPTITSPYYSGINPYALGFAMYTDIKRICDNPTDEDREWFPNLAGTPAIAHSPITRTISSA